jgi:hypothetical protein
MQLPRNRSTLMTSPWSMADFVTRLAFFALAPLAIVIVALLFPVRGALIDVALALGVFVTSEALRSKVRAFGPASWLVGHALQFEAYYREQRQRSFAYYVFYPLLFPYWLLNGEARREFLLYRGYTLGGLVLLVLSLAWQYFTDWAPELGVRQFLPFVLLSLAIETMLVLGLLMPIATTVVWYHSSLRHRRLMVVLGAGLLSTLLALGYVMQRRVPIVSYATRERVRLRSAAAPREAHRALRHAAREALIAAQERPLVQEDGSVEGTPLDAARDELASFFRTDEAAAFDLWTNPSAPLELMVVYFQARPRKLPIWVAVRADGSELRSPRELPAGAFRAMRRASDTGDAELWTWPDELNPDDEDERVRFHRRTESQRRRP